MRSGQSCEEVRMEKHIDAEGMERLCQAVIVQAAKDYRTALHTLKRNPASGSAKDTVNEIEKFLRSEYYESLTDVNGEYLIRKLREEAR